MKIVRKVLLAPFMLVAGCIIVAVYIVVVTACGVMEFIDELVER